MRGDDLHIIAGKYADVGWEQIGLANDDVLQAHYDRVCPGYWKRYPYRRNRAGRHGHFCNERYGRPYLNTLTPGLKLGIPAATAPPEIVEIVKRVGGQRIALVVDDTGSMNDDQSYTRQFAQYYVAAARQAGKEIVGVYLYADGEVRRYTPETVAYLTTGQEENTFGALREAASSGADTLILVTDEAGNDWPGRLRKRSLPEVIAHCLPRAGRHDCQEPLDRLVDRMGGEVILGGSQFRTSRMASFR